MISTIEDVTFRQRCWLLAGLAHLRASLSTKYAMNRAELLEFATNNDEFPVPTPEEIEGLMDAIDECDKIEIQEKFP